MSINHLEVYVARFEALLALICQVIMYWRAIGVHRIAHILGT